MELFQNMDMDQFVIVVPTVLIAVYLIITLEKTLSEKENKYLGLILPAISLLVVTYLAVRPLLLVEPTGQVIWLCIKMWLTFNLVTVVLLFPYMRARLQKKQYREAVAAMEAKEAEQRAETAEAASDEEIQNA